MDKKKQKIDQWSIPVGNESVVISYGIDAADTEHITDMGQFSETIEYGPKFFAIDKTCQNTAVTLSPKSTDTKLWQLQTTHIF